MKDLRKNQLENKDDRILKVILIIAILTIAMIILGACIGGITANDDYEERIMICKNIANSIDAEMTESGEFSVSDGYSANVVRDDLGKMQIRVTDMKVPITYTFTPKGGEFIPDKFEKIPYIILGALVGIISVIILEGMFVLLLFPEKLMKEIIRRLCH